MEQGAALCEIVKVLVFGVVPVNDIVPSSPTTKLAQFVRQAPVPALTL
jgi:hypothetical protein